MSRQSQWLSASILLFFILSITYLNVYQQKLEIMVEKQRENNFMYGLLRKTLHQLWNVVLQTNVIDANGAYYVFPKIFGEDVVGDIGNVTLISHCSLNHFHELVDVSRVWGGPISVTVFVPKQLTESELKLMLLTFLCASCHNKFVSVNLVTRLLDKPMISSFDSVLDEFFKVTTLHCETIPERLASLSSASEQVNYDNSQIPYPNNLLRNVGVAYAATDFVFVVDIDLVPSADLAMKFSVFIKEHIGDFINGSYDRTAFVVPVFEMQQSVSKEVPRTKPRLLEHIARNDVRPFYSQVCAKCQSSTLYEIWRNLLPGDGLKMAYTVPWRDPWEPFYIARRKSLPPYDGRFMQFGFNRISQVCELHMAGYTFSVLDNAFLVHQGFKTPDSFHASKQREQDKNRKLFRQFKEGLKRTYKDSKREC